MEIRARRVHHTGDSAKTKQKWSFASPPRRLQEAMPDKVETADGKFQLQQAFRRDAWDLRTFAQRAQRSPPASLARTTQEFAFRLTPQPVAPFPAGNNHPIRPLPDIRRP